MFQSFAWEKNEVERRKLVPYIVFVVVLSLFSGCFTASNSSGENSKPLIRVGSEVEFSPFALVDESGQPTGFSVDLIKAIADAAGLSIVFETGEWNKMWSGLVSGNLDVLPIVAKSNERKRLVDFGLPHTETFDAFFVRDGNPTIGSIEAAQGKKIVVMRSDAAHHELLERDFRGELVLVDTIPEGLSMVAAGKGDAFLCSKLIGTLAIKKHDIRGLTAGPLITDYKRVFSLGIKKGEDELREKLNQGLLIVKSSGQYDRIYEKWLTIDDPWLKYRKHLPLAFLVLAAIALLAMLGLAILRRLVKKRTAELGTKNRELEQQIVARKRVEEELLSHRQGLEIQIEERTRELKENEEKYRNLFTNAGVGMFRSRLDGSETLEVNDKFLKILNRTREGVLGKPSVVLWADPREREEMVRRLKIEGQVTDYEYRMLTAQGEVRNCLTSVRLYPENEMLEGTILDITDRKKAEEALRKSEERLDLALKGADLGIWDWNIETGKQVFNEQWAKMLGFSLDEIEPDILSWEKLVHPDDLQTAYERMRKHLEGAEPSYEMEQRLRTKSGEWKWVLSRAKVTERDEDGRPLRVTGTHLDVTDRKKAQEVLRMRENLLSQVIESISDGFFALDGNLVVTYFNESAEALLGRKREDVIHRQLFEAFPEAKGSIFEKNYTTALRENAHLVFETFFGIKPYENWYEVRVYPFEKGISVYFQVTTERKRVEELALQSARLRAVADLSSGVAHHFNNLLQIVMASTSLSLFELESGDLTQIKTNLEQMLAAATLGSETVKRLQTFANMRADVTESESAVFDISTTVRSAAEVFKPLWKSDSEKEGINIDLQLDLEDGCLVKGQENEMFEVLVNLIRNAAEALPQGGDIEVKVCREADKVVIAVRDSGTGIAGHDLPKVFQPFWSSKGVGIGKGMGLAVTHGLVKRHGGSISVESKLGVGTTFTIRLPLAQEPVTKAEQPSTITSGDHLTILVIDDDANIASLLERTCAKEGHTVHRALSGQDGLEIFNKEAVDLVISDLGMPSMNGWDVGKTIRSICQERGVRKPPFILLTGYGGQELEKDKISESGVDAVVAKPIDRATVLATVQEIAARFRSGSRVT